MATKRIDELIPGDLVDLQNDKYADRRGDNIEYEFELACVAEIDRETPDCICVYFENSACGFPPGHVVTVYQGSKES